MRDQQEEKPVNELARIGAAPLGEVQGCGIPLEALRSRLGELNSALYDDLCFAHAEAAVEEVADLLDMQKCWWTPDASSPYDCEPARQFSHSRGWPKELMEIWRKHKISLYSPFHIRSRFENLPYATTPDLRDRQHACAGYVRANHIVHELGIRSMLHVPVHLPKGRIGLVNWAGDHDVRELRKLLPHIAGELLALGSLFMRNFDAQRGVVESVLEERARLTVREWDCLRMLAQGYREAEAADLLDISKSTLRFHVENVVRKFGCKSRTQAVAMAAQLGLLGPIGS
jgi:DNA-binding CsgD family transcriptional regulator